MWSVPIEGKRVSIRVMTWVWNESKSKKNARLLLLAIADCASDDGSNAYPSITELMRKTGLSERAVQSTLADLVTLGELAVYRNAGPKGCNRYRVVMTDATTPQILHPADPAPAESAPPQKPTPTPADPAPGTVKEPSKNSSSKSSSSERKRGTRIPADFAIDDAMRDWAFAEATELGGREPDRAKLDLWLGRWTAEFIDYWTSRATAATKVNWVATWRNRMRTKLEQLASQTSQPGVAVAPRNGQPYVGTSDRKVAQVDLAVANVKARMQNGASQ